MVIVFLIITPQQWQDAVINKTLEFFNVETVELDASNVTVGEFEEEPHLVIGHQQIVDSLVRTRKEFACDQATRVLIIKMNAEYYYNLDTRDANVMLYVDTMIQKNYPATSTRWGRCNYEATPFDAYMIEHRRDSMEATFKGNPEMDEEAIKRRASDIIRLEYLKWRVQQS